MASERRNMFYQNKKQETTEIDISSPFLHCLQFRVWCCSFDKVSSRVRWEAMSGYPEGLDVFTGNVEGGTEEESEDEEVDDYWVDVESKFGFGQDDLNLTDGNCMHLVPWRLDAIFILERLQVTDRVVL
ncbi:hypothetical protein AAG570_005966 [Ranatra chinensis]|uniref:Uncharacterized protein n=1 Tax=Ranatra chinensis TaxID=642074 RepID=A0ABD0XWN5_9HEMI